MLQGLIFSYGYTQRYRLGVNHHQIPVNSPKGATNVCPFSRDGVMRVDGNMGSGINYYPNSYGVHNSDPDVKQPALELETASIYEHNFRDDANNYFEQPGKLFRIQTEEEKHRRIKNTAKVMSETNASTKPRHIYNYYQAETEYRKGVANTLAIDINDVAIEKPDFLHNV